MAANHARAVQEHSSIHDNLTRHILEVVALDIGNNDEPAFTSNRNIASRVRCSVNTVRDRLQEIINTGELIAVKDGKYMFYSLNQELIPYGRTSGSAYGNRAENERKGSEKRVATMDDLETLYQRLYQDQQTLYQTLYQNIVSIVSASSTDTDTEVKERKEEEEVKKERTKPRGRESAPNPFWSDLPGPLKTDAFIAAWNDWLTYTMQADVKFTPAQSRIALRDLEDIGPDRAVAAINESIKRGWRSIFEPRSDFSQQPVNGRSPTPSVDVARIFEELGLSHE